jgi:hypothetical protein
MLNKNTSQRMISRGYAKLMWWPEMNAMWPSSRGTDGEISENSGRKVLQRKLGVEKLKLPKTLKVNC